jgi:hypothetical protein
MGTTYTTTITVRCWKEHTCVGCEGTYAYRFERKVTGQAGTADGSKRAAETSAVRAVEREVDMHPCPTCGLFQPDMVGTQRARRHWYLFWVSLITFALLIILYLSEMMAPATVVWIGFLIGAATTAGHFLIDRRNPNSNLEANQALARQRVGTGILQTGTAGRAGAVAPEASDSGWSTGHTIAFAALVIAVLLLPLPEMVRAASGWTSNSGWYPPVAGPGDQPYVYLPYGITSVKGLWNATGTILLIDPAAPGAAPIAVPFTTQSNSWGDKISISSKSPTTSTSKVWVQPQLPNQAALAGKTVQLKIHLEVQYPELGRDPTGKEIFEPKSAAVDHTETLKLAGVGAGATYKQLWWDVMLGGGLFILIVTSYLIYQANAHKRLAPETKAYAAE